MLDDECRLPKGSDRNWTKRMYEQYLPEKKQTISQNTRFQATMVQKAKAIFCVRHFAGLVEYNAETNFMEKNKDEIPITAQALFETAPSQLIKDTYKIQQKENLGRAPPDTGTGRKPKAKTVGQQFKEQLVSLIDNVQKTDPHYIRCIKPNDAAKPLMMTRKRTTEQLRYGGVLEAVRVARAGYPVRLYHQAFYERYRMLLPSVSDQMLPWSMEGHEPQKLCVRLVDKVLEHGAAHRQKTLNGPLDANEEGISRSEKIRRMQNQPIHMAFPKTDVQLGKTKVFMRKHPHDCLEAHRVFHQHASATVIQCWARGLAQQRKLLIIQSAVQTIQRTWRGAKGREKYVALTECAQDRGSCDGRLTWKSVFFLQLHKTSLRHGWYVAHEGVPDAYQLAKVQPRRKGTVRYQAVVRGRNVRRLYAAILVQKYHRRYVAHKKYRQLKSALLALQCAVRVRTAKKALLALTKEQKDVGKLKQNNERLKQEMASLRAMLSAQAKESAANEEHNQALKEKEDIIAGLEKRIAEIEKELAKAKATVEKLEKELEEQKEESHKDKEQIQQLRQRRHSQLDASGPTRHARNDSSEKIIRRASSKEYGPSPAGAPADYVSPAALAEHKAMVSELENRLEAERKLRRDADGEVIKLRAAMNGVQLDDLEIKALLGSQKGGATGVASDSSSTFSGDGHATTLRANDEMNRDPESTGAEKKEKEVQEALSKLGIEKPKDEKPSFMESIRASADFIPMIRRGFQNNEEKEEEDVVAVGWKVEIRTRREREEALRDGAHRFESKMKKFMHTLEEGFDVVMWQLNRARRIWQVARSLMSLP